MNTICNYCGKGLKIASVFKHDSQAAIKIRYECSSPNCNGYKVKMLVIDEKRYEEYLQNEFKKEGY
jgi:hypothetical protein